MAEYKYIVRQNTLPFINKAKPDLPNEHMDMVLSGGIIIGRNLGIQTIKKNLFNIAAGDDSTVRLNPMIAPQASQLGTPIFANVIFKLDDERELRIDTCTVDISMTKNIVKTVIQGRTGTVKEYISAGDYNIAIRGKLVAADQFAYPNEDMNTLLGCLLLQRSFEVYADFLHVFNIYNIVIESFRFVQRPGFQNTQDFELIASSDDPLELQQLKNA